MDGTADPAAPAVVRGPAPDLDPDAAGGHIARPDLEQRMADALERTPLTLVVAPAGSGKSVLLSRIARRCNELGIEALGLRCTSEHSDAAVFRKCVAAPFGARRTRVLLIDDYHLCENAANNAILADLIHRRGGDVHVVLASTIRPSLHLANLRMRSLVSEFGQRDLAVRHDEVEAFLRCPAGGLDDGLRDWVMRYTGGWIAALQFIALCIQERASVADVMRDRAMLDRHIHAYFQEEIFEPLAEPMRRYLLMLAHLEQISEPLGLAVTGLAVTGEGAPGYRHFEELLSRGLFVTPVDRGRSWYRLHPLFRDFLLSRGHEAGLSSRTVRSRAAHWHWAQGDWCVAVHYAIDADECDVAAEWLLQCGEKVITDRGEVAAFRACCERLADSGAASFELLQWMVWTAAFTMSWSDASALLARHLGTVPAEELDSGRNLLLRALMSYFSHDFGQTIELAGRWWEEVETASPFDRATIAAVMAFSLKTMLRKTQAKAWLERARLQIARSGSDYGQAWIQSLSTFVALTEGRPIAARQEAQGFLDGLRDAPMSLAVVEPVLAEACYELDMADQADALARKHTNNPDGCAALEIAFCPMRIAAFLQFNANGAEAAVALVETWQGQVLRRFAKRGGDMLRLLKQDLVSRISNELRRDLVLRFDLDTLTQIDADWPPDLAEKAAVILAREHLIAGRPAIAIERVRHIIGGSAHDGRWIIWTEAMLVRATAQRALGDTARGERALVECLSRVAPLGVLRTVLDNAIMLRPFAAFLGKLAHGQRAADAETQALALRLTREMGIPAGSALPCEAAIPVEALTRQEARILSLLAEGLSNAELCDRLVLTTATVKWHIYNLFQKLGVHSRTAAVREGRLRGLLS